MDDYAERMHRAGYQAYEDHVLGVEQIPLKSLYHDWGPLQQTEPQSPAARVIPGWLPLAAYGTGLALGESKPLSGIGDMLTPNVNSVAMEGPMRLSGRGIPHHGPVTSGGPLSRGEPWKRQMGRVHDYYRPGGRWDKEYYADNPVLSLGEVEAQAREERERIGYGEGQVDPSFYRTPQNPVYQNRVAINADDQYNMLPTDVIDKRKLRQNLHLNNSAANYFTEPFQEALPYTTGVAAGGTDTRSDWQKWKDSFKKDWAVAK